MGRLTASCMPASACAGPTTANKRSCGISRDSTDAASTTTLPQVERRSSPAVTTSAIVGGMGPASVTSFSTKSWVRNGIPPDSSCTRWTRTRSQDGCQRVRSTGRPPHPRRTATSRYARVRAESVPKVASLLPNARQITPFAACTTQKRESAVVLRTYASNARVPRSAHCKSSSQNQTKMSAGRPPEHGDVRLEHSVAVASLTPNVGELWHQR